MLDSHKKNSSRSSSTSLSVLKIELLDFIFNDEELDKELSKELDREEFSREEFSRELSKEEFDRECIIKESDKKEFDLSKSRALSSNTDIKLLNKAVKEE